MPRAKRGAARGRSITALWKELQAQQIPDSGPLDLYHMILLDWQRVLDAAQREKVKLSDVPAFASVQRSHPDIAREIAEHCALQNIPL